MNEKDWLIIRAVYHHKNITRAAEQLYTSQPALSYRLKQIERKLAIQLFDENSKGLAFSAQGEFLASHADKVLRDMQQLKINLHSLDEQQQGEIRIGVSSNYAAYRLPALLARFRQQYPGVSINLISGYSEEIFQRLQRDDIHLALVKDDFNWKEGKQLVDEDYYYLVSQHEINFGLLPHLPQIKINHGPHITQLIERWWNANFSLAPRIAMTVDKLEVCLAMVNQGLGYAIISSYLPLPDALYRLPISVDGQAVTNKTWLLHRHACEASPMTQPFIQMLADYAALPAARER
ncbi:LysR family transcriptional regulator [Acerihabitans arboris]|uniref:LysR family transcriptional regulator n=1 Tax=Acerihabitans arboris TaxID=2691583 RepID=A0A845SRE1_9GAMM|nr:LysR family transcriptional regulator [Acerihabitans arboris]NDL65198.1 LysR family transcriptional regulator [Acerihabitans arboris]